VVVARIETLKRRADFLRLKTGQSWAMPSFVLQASPSPPHSRSPEPRFGFTVSDKAVRENQDGQAPRAGAVKRNRARRRLKEAVRLAAPFARPDFDYVVIGRRAALDMDFASLIESMKQAFVKVHEPQRRRLERKRRASGARPEKAN
jgi:ribonuclease P protein component